MKDYKLSEIKKICEERITCTNCSFIDEFGQCYFKVATPCNFEIDKNTLEEIKKFLFVEDGSVNYDELVERIAETNPEIYVILYRQGSVPPQLIEVAK